MNRAAAYPANWTAAGLFAMALVVLSALLDGQPSEQQAEADTAASIEDARHAAHRERAAVQICTELHGPGAEHMWDMAGSLVCMRAPAPPTTLAKAL